MEKHALFCSKYLTLYYKVVFMLVGRMQSCSRYSALINIIGLYIFINILFSQNMDAVVPKHCLISI